MDGLSLLGLVAEQRLGERKDWDCSGLEGKHHEYSRGGTQHTLVVKPEDVKVELQENGETDTTTDRDSEFESSTSIVAGKYDHSLSNNSVALRGLTKHLKLTNQHFERSSQSIATHLNVYDFGQFQYKVMENQLCKYSKYTGWHLQRSTGMMKIKLSFRSILAQGPMLVRALLVRKDETYRHFGVDRICENHMKEVELESRHHVLQAAPGLEGMWQFGSGGPRHSLCFFVGIPHPETGNLEETIGLKCICNDSCSTCDDRTFKQTESSRDLLLVLTLESVEFGIILARRSFGVWPKAVVRPKDLNKPERRKPKGGAAKLNKMREALEIQRPEVRNLSESGAAPQLHSQVHPESHQIQKKEIQRVTLANGLGLSNNVFKIAPKIPVISGKLSGCGVTGKQTFNILLPVESKNGIPTTVELMDTTIGLAIKNARTLGLSNEEFLKRIEERLKEGSAVN